MPFNPFIGRDQTWLEAQLRSAQDELASGKSAISGQMGEVTFGNAMTIGPAQPPQVAITTPASGATYTAPATVTISDAAPAGTEFVEFTGDTRDQRAYGYWKTACRRCPSRPMAPSLLGTAARREARL